MTSRSAIGVDIGGTKIHAAVVDGSGRILASRRVPTPGSGDPEVVWAAVAAAIDALPGIDPQAGSRADRQPGPRTEQPPAPLPLGVVSAGPIDVDAGTVSPVNIGAWRGFPLAARLTERYRRPVRLLGDAVAVAVAEHWVGAARGVDDVLGMVVSTGIGGGLITGGRVLPGATGNAGHIGHVSVDPRGPRCACGGTGCVEAIASGTAIGRYVAERTADRPAPLTTAAAAAQAAAAGDPVALAAFERAGRAIGMAVAAAVTLVDLELVVIGGGVAAAGELLFGPLADGYAAHAGLGYARRPRVVPAALGGDAGVVGAAALVLAPDRYWPRGT